MLKVSKFLVVVPQNNNFILFQTFTSSLIILNNEIYKKIFIDHDFIGIDNNIINNLMEMSFLVSSDTDENFHLETIRTKARYHDNDIKMVTIAPTYNCNARCYYCYEKGIEPKTMSKSTADAVVNFLERNNREKKLTLSWFGGEPLLCKDLIDYISGSLREKNFESIAVITTNGYFIDDDVIKKSNTLWNIKRFQITIDDIGENYNKIKSFINSSDGFTRVINNIQKLLENNIKVNVRINFDPNQIKNTLSTIDYLKEKFGNYPSFFMYVAAINATNVDSVLNKFEDHMEHPYFVLLKKMRSLGFLCPTSLSTELETKFDDEEVLRYLNLRSRPISCYATCLNKFVIDPDGNLYKCHRLLGRGERFICGNIYNGIKYNNAYHTFIDGKFSSVTCENCNILPICQGGCKVKAMLYGEKEACIANKAIMSDLVKLLAEEMMKG